MTKRNKSTQKKTRYKRKENGKGREIKKIQKVIHYKRKRRQKCKRYCNKKKKETKKRDVMKENEK